MRRSSAPWIAFPLLILGGVAFAWLVGTAGDLQRRDALRRAEDRAQSDLERLAARLAPRARAPHRPPAETWRLIASPDVDPRTSASEAAVLSLAEASYAERAGEPERAYAIYARLAGGADERLARLAALRAGTAAHRVGRDAQEHFTQAAAAPAELADPQGIGVRVAACYHLARLELAAQGPGPALEAFLREIDHGHTLVPTAPVTRAALLDVLAALAPTDPRIAAAATAARTRDRLARLDDGAFTVFGHPPRGPPCVFLRRGSVVERYGADVLARPEEDGAARLRLAGIAPAEDERVRALDAPFDVFDAIARLEMPADSIWLSVVPWIGLAVYLFGALLAILALRRSARAVEMQGDFVAAVSHELKTPIASVRAMAEMLADGNAPPDRIETYAGRMAVEMERLGNTVRNVLDVARIERQGRLALDREVVAVDQLVRRVAETVRPALTQSGHALEVAVEPPRVDVKADAEALTGAIVNLIDNAVKFDTESRRIGLLGEARDDGYRIVVEDRGPGVAPNERSRLFTRFARGAGAKAGAVPGIGLGLYVVKQVALAHGGTVHVEGRDGGGARFVIDLPGEDT